MPTPAAKAAMAIPIMIRCRKPRISFPLFIGNSDVLIRAGAGTGTGVDEAIVSPIDFAVNGVTVVCFVGSASVAKPFPNVFQNIVI